jgi:hypothetical protein
MESAGLETRLGPLACRSPGQGLALVFFADSLANGDPWVTWRRHWRTATETSPSTARWEPTPGRCCREQTGQPAHWPGC